MFDLKTAFVPFNPEQLVHETCYIALMQYNNGVRDLAYIMVDDELEQFIHHSSNTPSELKNEGAFEILKIMESHKIHNNWTNKLPVVLDEDWKKNISFLSDDDEKTEGWAWVLFSAPEVEVDGPMFGGGAVGHYTGGTEYAVKLAYVTYDALNEEEHINLDEKLTSHIIHLNIVNPDEEMQEYEPRDPDYLEVHGFIEAIKFIDVQKL